MFTENNNRLIKDGIDMLHPRDLIAHITKELQEVNNTFAPKLNDLIALMFVEKGKAHQTKNGIRRGIDDEAQKE